MIKNTLSKVEVKEALRRVLEGTFIKNGKDLSEETLELIFKYYFLEEKYIDESEKNKIKEMYLKTIEQEKEKIKKDIEIDKITQIISGLSFSAKNKKISEYPFEKDFRIFPNIKKYIYFIQKKPEKIMKS